MTYDGILRHHHIGYCLVAAASLERHEHQMTTMSIGSIAKLNSMYII